MIGYVNKIETMGLLDGPGLRTVVFMQGCPLRCVFCHNPETWKTKIESTYTEEELVEVIKRYKNYYGDTGGVTFSGGEPLVQSKFLTKVSKKCKQENIHVCLDTSGVGFDYEELLEYTDLIMLSIKHVEANEYQKIAGAPMDQFLKFIDVCNKKNKKIWIRQVIIPGLTDSKIYIQKLKEFLKKINNIEKIELLPYHTLGVQKYKELGLPYKLNNIGDMDKEKCMELEKLLKI